MLSGLQGIAFFLDKSPEGFNHSLSVKAEVLAIVFGEVLESGKLSLTDFFNKDPFLDDSSSGMEYLSRMMRFFSR